MRRLFFISLSAVACLAAHDDWSLNNHFGLYGEFVYMRRAKLHSHTFVDQVIPLSPQNVIVKKRLNTDNLMRLFKYRPGYRLGATYTPNKKRSFDLSYLQVGEWKGRRAARGAGELKFPFDRDTYTHDFVHADRAVGRYHSNFDNWELNYWGHLTPRRADYFSVSGIVGLRFIDLRESFKAAFTRDGQTSDYNIGTKNHLYGAQIGGNLQINPTRLWSWDMTVKGGGLINRAEQKTLLRDEGNTVTLRDFDHRQYRWTYFGAAQIALACQFWRYANAHGGYEMLYLSGVALAPEQISNKTGSVSGKHLDAYGNVLIHGLFAGLTFSF
jgi:hypothetical protein